MPILFPIDSKISQSDVINQVKSSTLIIPSVSIGNVPQLSVDLLIHNYNFKLIANLDSTFLYPFASPVDYVDSPVKGISTALQLYYDEANKLSIIQQRSPILPSYSKKFLNYLITLIKTTGFKDVIFLDSNDYGFRNGQNLGENVDIYSNKLDHSFKTLTVSKDFEDSKLNFTKFTSSLLDTLKEDTASFSELNYSALVIFVYEGDNFHDAFSLTTTLLKFLEIESVKEFKTPVSWKGVYGDRPIPLGLEQGIYA